MDISNNGKKPRIQKIKPTIEERQRKYHEYYALHKNNILAHRRAHRMEQRSSQQTIDGNNNRMIIPPSSTDLYTTLEIPLSYENKQRPQIEPTIEEAKKKDQEYYVLHKNDLLAHRCTDKKDRIQYHSLDIQTQRIKKSTTK